jgi:large subunit ribosomal protein L18e
LKIKGRTDPNKKSLIISLNKAGIENKASIWKRISKELTASNRKRVAINLSHINRVTNAGEYIVVPGKVLGSGTLKHKLNIAAESFSEAAKEKIISTGSKCLSLEELIASNPKGTNVKIVK